MIPSNIGIFIIAIIIIAVLAWKNTPRWTYNRVPKKIWSYWENPDNIPKTIRLCMESWKKYHPDYEIVLMNKTNYMGFTTIPEEIQKQHPFRVHDFHFVDLLRLYTLAEHGGIWIDPSVLIKESFDTWLFPRYGEFSGFSAQSSLPSSPDINMSFLACNKHSALLKKWRDEFVKLLQYSDVERYVSSRKQMGVYLDHIVDPIYHPVKVALQTVFQVDKYSQEHLIIRSIEDGPLRYVRDAKGNSEKALQLACLDKKYQEPIMLMRESERMILEQRLDHDLSDERCGWSRSLFG